MNRNTKHILFIAPEFFGYHLQLKTAMEELGHRVTFIPDRPSKAALIKILIRKTRFLLTPYLNAHFRHQSEMIEANSVDEIFIIRGEGLTAKALHRLKERFPDARVQLYLWDSVLRSHGCKSLIPLCYRAWTYDLRDAEKFPQLRFTPNFFALSENLSGKKAPIGEYDWDLVFFGTAHGDRLKVLSKIAAILPRHARFYIFLYFQSWILFYARKLLDPAFKTFSPDQLGLKAKFGSEWEEVIMRASAILDIVHPQQGGLTIRTLEALALGFKVVTTDDSIRKYPFYNSRQILVIDRNDPTIPVEFLKIPNDFPVHPAIKDLELPNWLKRFFDTEVH